VTIRAAVLSTGDELTTGRIVDTNSSWIADKLFDIGVDVVAVLTVGDYPERLAWAWRQAMALADVSSRPAASAPPPTT
jgi:nicotinamide-nucleotide amidase